MDVLVAGERGELLDPRLDVVPGDPLAGRDGVEVDLLDDGLVGLHDAVRHLDPEVALRLEHGDPELPLEDDLVLRRPDPDQVVGGVAVRQDVGDVRCAHAAQTPAAMSVRWWLPATDSASTPA